MLLLFAWGHILSMGSDAAEVVCILQLLDMQGLYFSVTQKMALSETVLMKMARISPHYFSYEEASLLHTTVWSLPLPCPT